MIRGFDLRLFMCMEPDLRSASMRPADARRPAVAGAAVDADQASPTEYAIRR
ncbi:hypothetical protein [Methylorubrum salsuginis]|uniref:hypothetical protein n=1 Tax=Methylorubrum salsuginis TaxID=414703 RepID=UPI0013F4D7E5|nr:hypothetical protein [Methylorubrum salsuginis]